MTLTEIPLTPPPVTVTLKAPLSGVMVAIEQVPDPVFAQKMVGDGISIDPVSQVLVAPCDGEVIQLHPSHHAVTIRTADEVELLMHIGLDTVTLRGQGFTPRVKEGDRVRLGDPLIEFDADYLALHAKSLLTEILVINGDRVTQIRPRSGAVVVGQDVVLELVLQGTSRQAKATSGETVTSELVMIPNPVGLHARPAAVLANLAKKYQSAIHLKVGDQQVNARSVVGVMGLQVGYKAMVQLSAIGPDAAAAIAELSDALRAGLGEEGARPAAAPASIAQAEIAKPAPQPRSQDANLVLGVAASPGVAVGTLYHVKRQQITVAETGGNPNQERRQLEQAIAQARLEIEALRARIHSQGDPKKAAIFAAHQELLEDPELVDTATSAIDKGKSAAYAWQRSFTAQADQLAQLQNQLLAERANDLRDVGNRVLRILTGSQVETSSYPEQTILAAEDLTPSDLTTLDRFRVIGLCTVGGGATSHVAILARSLDMPAIAGIEPRVLELADGTPVILDGSQGVLRLHPSSDQMKQTQQRQLRLKQRRQQELAAAHTPAITQDGHRIEVVANIGSQADAATAISLGGEGVGLLRTEFVFMERDHAPTEAEQTEIYSDIVRLLGPERPVIIRTLDIGGDKPLPYLPMPPEENPFLGERGVRVGFDRPELLRTQLRAILRAAQFGKVRVMFPMIARMEEWRMAKALLEQERRSLGVRPIPAGIMVEVPSTAVLASQFAEVADFFSVGSNDLTQYTLAMDRGHPKLAPYVDALHPAVLTLVANAARAVRNRGKWLGVCGGVASDPQAVPILIGMGVTELSVSVPTIPSIKAQIRELNLADCQKLAQRALRMATGAEVRQLYPVQED
ncbi:MAG: phosphoenolpyruvate--protein phosphotransferase [Leptolyngbyaceae cyanobacterium]